jgi:hypothetical protein
VLELVQVFFTAVFAVAGAFKNAIRTQEMPKDENKPPRTANTAC